VTRVTTLSQHQRLIADLLMRAEAGELMRGMVSMPPGHCKSTHCSHHFPAWYLGRNPRRRFLQAGHSQDFVENEMGAKVRDIINSEDYGHIFPDIHIRTDMKAKAYWGLSNRKGSRLGKHFGLNCMTNHTFSSSKGRWNPRASTVFIRERQSTSKVR
jgi:hypothetical protein